MKLLEKIDEFNQAAFIILKIPLAIALIVAISLLALVFWDAHKTENLLNANLPNSFVKLNQDLDQVHSVLGHIDTAANDADSFTATETEELAAITKLVNGNLTQLKIDLVSFNTLLGTSNVAAGQLSNTVASINQNQNSITKNLNAFIGSSTITVNDFDAGEKKFLSDQDIIEMIHHWDNTSAHIDATTSTIQDAAQKYFNPQKCTGKWCWAIDTYKIVKGTYMFAEPTYFGYEFLQAIKH